MANIPDKIQTWQMIEPGKLEKVSIDVPEIKPGELAVGCATPTSAIFMMACPR